MTQPPPDAHRWRSVRRCWRHLATDHRSARRAFPAALLETVESAIAGGERRHRGQVRFVVEPSLPLPRVLAGLSPRERALEVFGLMRVWDTEDNAGVLVYLLLADRDVEIVADRGIDRHVGAAEWEAVCRTMEDAFRDGRFADGAQAGIARINALLETHFPRRAAGAGNELPDQPVIL
jgi:uncharacterized membrane protein